MITRDTLLALDREDPLARFRDAFELPDGVIYLDANSLGPLPRRTLARLIDVAREEWGQSLVRSWNDHDWIGMPRRIGDAIAPLIGAEASEVIVADSTSVDLFKLLAAALRLRPGRSAILTEEGNFPTDLYIAEGLTALSGHAIGLRRVPKEGILAAIDEDVAVVSLTEVDYRTGELLDMAKITAAAHAQGALTVWDLSHSAGALPVDLNGARADFAVGCGYKYLNGGPGAPAFLFVAGRHQQGARQPLSGWMGHRAPFAFEPRYAAADGIERHLCGTPPILSMAALEEGVALFAEADMDRIRHKSVLMTEAFIALVEQECGIYGFDLASPREPSRRGSQASFSHPEAYAVMQALISRGVIGDFRAPDLMRFGFAPLYVRFEDLWIAASILREVMAESLWDRPEFKARAAVT